MYNRIQIFPNGIGLPMAEDISKRLSIPLGKLKLKRFSDGEIYVQLEEEVRDNDTFIVCPTQPPAENLIEALLIADAVRQASARRVTLVIPYLGYNRQDRKDRPRVPRSALVLIKALKESVDRVLLLDLHSEVTMGFFDPVIVDHLYGSKIIQPALQRILKGKDFVVASPDKGGGPRAEKYAELLGHDDYVVFTKSRPAPNEVGKVKIIGNIHGKTVVFVDDMIDTGGTMVADAHAAKAEGATDIIAVATHGLLSGEAVKNIDESPIDTLMLTDTVSGVLQKAKKFKQTKVIILPAAELLAQGIRRIHDGQSVSSLIL